MSNQFCLTRKSETVLWFCAKSIIVFFLILGSVVRTGYASLEQKRKIKMIEEYFPSEALKIINVYGDQADSFPSGYKIEVKNISKKPIYFIGIVGQFPLYKKYYGDPLGFKLQYGNAKLVTVGRLAESNDVPLMPGETAMLATVGQTGVWCNQGLKDKGIFEEVSYEVTLIPQFVSFGDGSGYQFNKYYQK